MRIWTKAVTVIKGGRRKRNNLLLERTGFGDALGRLRDGKRLTETDPAIQEEGDVKQFHLRDSAQFPLRQGNGVRFVKKWKLNKKHEFQRGDFLWLTQGCQLPKTSPVQGLSWFSVGISPAFSGICPMDYLRVPAFDGNGFTMFKVKHNLILSSFMKTLWTTVLWC